MADVRTASQRIGDEVASWPGVEVGRGQRGELALRIGRREFGHLHGNRVAHFGFPRELGSSLRAQGRVGPHPARPDHPSWAARQIEDEADVLDVIALLRLNYERVVARFGLPGEPRATP